MDSSAQGTKAYADGHGPCHVNIFIVLIAHLRPATRAKDRRSERGGTKKALRKFKRRHGRKSGPWFRGSFESVGQQLAPEEETL